MNQCFQIFHRQNHTPSSLTFQSLQLVLAGASIKKFCGLKTRNFISQIRGIKKSKIGQNQEPISVELWYRFCPCIALNHPSILSFFSKDLSSEYFHTGVFNVQIQDNTGVKSTIEILLQQTVLGVQICQRKTVSSFILTISSYYCNTRFNQFFIYILNSVIVI